MTIKVYSFAFLILLLVSCSPESEIQSEDDLKPFIGRSFRSVLTDLKIDIHKSNTINEPPGIFRGVSSNSPKVSIYVTRNNAIKNFKDTVNPKAFLDKKVEGVAYFVDGKWLKVGKGIIPYYHSN